MAPRKACKMIVGILALAHRADCESRLGSYLQDMMAGDSLPSLHELQQKFEKIQPVIPAIEVNHVPAASYDALLITGLQEVH